MLRSVAVLGLTWCAALGQAQSLVYHETSGGKTEVRSYAITPREGGYLVVLDRRGEGVEIVDRRGLFAGQLVRELVSED
jgi:hypothetical protein